MQTKKKAITALIAAILVFSMVFVVLPIQPAGASPISVPQVWMIDEDVGVGDGAETEFYLDYPPIVPGNLTVYFDGVVTTAYSVDNDTGAITFAPAPDLGVDITADYRQADPYGEVGLEVLVNGTDATPGGYVQLYWDGVHDWDEEDHTGYLDKEAAGGDGSWEFESVAIPECASDSAHWLLAYDTMALEVESVGFTVVPDVEASPDKGVPEDIVEVSGTGFSAEEDVTIWFTLTNGTVIEKLEDGVGLDVFGSFPAEEVEIPEVDDGPYHIFANDTLGAEATALFTVGLYVTVDPDKGPPGTEVDIEGRLSPDSEVDVKFGFGWDDVAPPDDDWTWYTYVLKDVETDSDGFFDDTFTVPSASEGDYLVMAIDAEDPPEYATDEFEVVEEPAIDLDPGSGLPGDEIDIDGFFFTADSDITLKFNGIDITPAEGIETDSDGEFDAEFEVPDVDVGSYEVTATDEEGLSAEEDFDVMEFMIVIKPRAGPYYRGETISFFINTTETMGDHGEEEYILISIEDSEGYPFWVDIVFETIEWPEDSGYHTVPYGMQYYYVTDASLQAGFEVGSGLFFIPSDAPLGTWTWEITASYDEGDEEEELSGTFTVLERPYETMLDKLGDIDASLVSIEDGVATIETSTGTIEGTVTALSTDVVAIKTDLGTVTGKVTTIDGSVATIKTDLGTVKADVSDIKGYFPIEVPLPDLTPMWVAAILSLIAAVAAIAAVVQISRKLA